MKHLKPLLLNEREYHYGLYFDYWFSEIMKFLSERKHEDYDDYFMRMTNGAYGKSIRALSLKEVFPTNKTQSFDERVEIALNGFGKAEPYVYFSACMSNAKIGFFSDTKSNFRASFMNDFGTPIITVNTKNTEGSQRVESIEDIMDILEDAKTLISHEFIHMIDSFRVQGKVRSTQKKRLVNNKPLGKYPTFMGYKNADGHSDLDTYYNYTHEVNAYVHMVLNDLPPSEVAELTWKNFQHVFYTKLRLTSTSFLDRLNPKNKRKIHKLLYDYYSKSIENQSDIE